MADIRTTCAYCGVGCGIAARVTGPRSIEVRGDPDHPANHGRLCSKGTWLSETVGLEGRLLHPMIGDARTGWDDALDHVAGRMRDAIARHWWVWGLRLCLTWALPWFWLRCWLQWPVRPETSPKAP